MMITKHCGRKHEQHGNMVQFSSRDDAHAVHWLQNVPDVHVDDGWLLVVAVDVCCGCDDHAAAAAAAYKHPGMIVSQYLLNMRHFARKTHNNITNPINCACDCHAPESKT